MKHGHGQIGNHIIMIPLRIRMCHVRKFIYIYIYIYIYTYVHVYVYKYSKIGPKCGKWDYGGLKMWEVGLWGSKNVGSGTMGGLKMWEVGLWGSKNVGSGTLGSKKCGKWDFQDAVSPPQVYLEHVHHGKIHINTC